MFSDWLYLSSVAQPFDFRHAEKTSTLSDSEIIAERAFDPFLSTYEAKYQKATECLRKDRDVLHAF